MRKITTIAASKYDAFTMADADKLLLILCKFTVLKHLSQLQYQSKGAAHSGMYLYLYWRPLQ